MDQTTAATDPNTRDWMTVVGTIRKGMPVIDAEGKCLGHVACVENEEIMFDDGDGHDFVTISQVDGVGETGVLLSGRGDATFGMPAAG